MPGTGKTACVHAVVKKLKIESQNLSLAAEANSNKRITENGRSNSKKSKSKKISFFA